MANPRNRPLRTVTSCQCGGEDCLVVESFKGVMVSAVKVSDSLVIRREDFRLTEVMTRCSKCRLSAPLRHEHDPSPAVAAIDLGVHTIKDEHGHDIEIQVFRDPVSHGVFAVESDFIDQVSEVINSPFNSDTLLSLPDPAPGMVGGH